LMVFEAKASGSLFCMIGNVKNGVKLY